jgi:NAD(P)H-hydrate repair Nnr-like enzyme with NAD(P)H-hydrate dehydratase domain
MNLKEKMENTNWLKQTSDKPQFPDLLWSRPENRKHAGKLLIIGGNKHAVAAPGIAFSAAQKAGVGTCRALLPNATKKMIGKFFPEAEFAASTPSGSFGREGLAQLLELAEWSDGVLLAGDFGRNSETAILLESFAQKYTGQLTIAQDAVDYFLQKNSALFERENTLAVINYGKLQKLAQNNRPTPPIKYEMNMHQLVEIMQQWKINLITSHAGQFVAAANGKVSTIKMAKESNWQIELAAYASVWWLQQPQKSFEAYTTAVLDYANS